MFKVYVVWKELTRLQRVSPTCFDRLSYVSYVIQILQALLLIRRSYTTDFGNILTLFGYASPFTCID